MTEALDTIEGINIRVWCSSEEEPLAGYIRQHGFDYGGEWYFRTTWMNRTTLRALEKKGIVAKVGTIKDLKAMGISLPENQRGYSSSTLSSIVYKIRARAQQ